MFFIEEHLLKSNLDSSVNQTCALGLWEDIAEEHTYSTQVP